MVNTYKYLKQTNTSKFENMTNEQLAKMYQQNTNGDIVSHIFCKHFGYWQKLAQKINIIDSEDKASIILEKLHDSLKTFDETKSNSFLAYAYVNIFNAFGGIKTKHKFKGKCCEQLLVSLDDNTTDDLTIGDMIFVNEYLYDEIDLKLNISLSKSLNKSEKQYCKILIENPGITTNDVAVKMNVTTQYVWVLKKKLQLKINSCLGN